MDHQGSPKICILMTTVTIIETENFFISINQLVTKTFGNSLVVQWLRIYVAMQGMWVQFLVGETKVSHATEQLSLLATAM